MHIGKAYLLLLVYIQPVREVANYPDQCDVGDVVRYDCQQTIARIAPARF